MSLGEYIPTSNTKLLLHLNGNSTDSSGNGNNGTDTNITYGLGYGRFGQGASFNGSNSRININDSETFNFAANNFTISCFVKRSTTNVEHGIMGQCDSAFSAGSVAFFLHITNANVLRAAIYNSSNSTVVIASTATVDANWHHILFQRSGNNLYLYMDNKLMATQDCTGFTIKNSTSKLAIGILGESPYGPFSGNIDEVIIENRAWSASEINKYYTMTKGRFGII